MRADKYQRSKSSNIIYTLVILILIGIVLFSGYQVFKILWNYHAGTSAYEDFAELAGHTADWKPEDGGLDWEALQKVNPQIRGWLYQKSSKYTIDFAVVQSKDNQDFLYRLFDGTWNSMGTPFIDYRCTEPFAQFMTVIYGHRMKNHTVFWYLADYRNDPEYYKECPTLDLMTPEKDYTVEVFAALTIPSDSPRYQFNFPDDASKQEYLDWVRANSTLQTDVTVTPEDKIIMLSTCSREDDARLGDARAIVYGKLVPKK